ncbi:nucleoprotein TPR-like isoform X3 [Rhodnius prolixus]|uniref:nucleoprotein TPR-like isoform X3 n=1 Tax=Rhodnius prolixus TaxID=13249 RepID=UPI003D188EB0
MEDEAKTLLLKTIPVEEYESIGEPLRQKIEHILKEHINDFLAAKAFFETNRAAQEEKAKGLEEQLTTITQDRDEKRTKFEDLQKQFEENSKNLTSVTNQLNKVKNEVQRLERAAEALLLEKDEAVNEKQTTANILERREAELERLRSDIGILNTELKAAIQAKCEAIALNHDIQSKQIDLSYKEKMLESERELLSKQMVALNEDLCRANNELTKQRREATNQIVTLQATISEKEEELKIIKEQKTKLQEHNDELADRLDSLTERLRKQRADEQNMQDGLQQQLHAQIKLAEIFKVRLTESEEHAAELGSAVKELQDLLQEASTQYGELETRLSQSEQDAAATLQAKQEAIKALKQELKEANHLLEAVRPDPTETAVSCLSPVAAAGSKLIKSGLTLTQLYVKFSEVTRELIVERNEKESLKAYVETVLKKIEEKAPLIQRQKEEYEFALSSMEALNFKVNELEEEHGKLRRESVEAQSTVERLTHYNRRLQESVKDLNRQICYLLREVEAARGNYLPLHETSQHELQHEMKSCSDVISKHLVTFNGVEELKLINLRLLVSLIELASFKEDDELEKKSPNKDAKDMEVLQKYFVKFDSLEQLQLLNFQLLSSIKELSAEREREEFEKERKELEENGNASEDKKFVSKRVKELQDELEHLTSTLKDYQEKEKFLLKQVEVLKNQRDIYHKLYTKNAKGDNSIEIDISKGVDIQNMEVLNETPLKTEKSKKSSQKTEKKELSDDSQARRLIEDLRKEYDVYRQERTANEKMLLETVDKLRTDLSVAIKDRAELASRAEYNQATCERLKSKLKTLEIEKDALEKRCTNFTSTINNLESNLRRVNNEAMESLNKLSLAEMTVTNLKEENSLLKQNESRLLKEKESQMKELHGQELLMASLENLKVKFECAESEAKLKLESRLDDANNECAALRRRLQEEQDRLTRRMELLEKQTNIAKQRLEEEIALRQKTNDELEVCKAEIKERDHRLEHLSEQLTVAINQSQPVLDRENKIKDLEGVVRQKDAAIKGLEDQMAINKKCMAELSDVSLGIEKQLSEVTEQFDQYKQEAEKKISELQATEVDLRGNVRTLEVKLKTMHASEAEERAARDAELSNLRTRVESLGTVLNDARERALKAETEAREAAEGTRTAELRAEHLATEKNKLARELDEIRTELSKVKAELETAKNENSRLQATIELERKSLGEKVKALSEESASANEKITDLTKVNDLLHDQIQELGAKVSVFNTSGSASISFSAEDSFMAEFKESDKLLEVLRLMRKEKCSANAQFESLRGEKLKLEAEVEILKGQLNDMKRTLEQERTSSDTPSISAERHAQFLNKMETLNQLTENNKTLLEEKERLEQKLSAMEQQLSNIETETIQPSKLKITELEASVEQLSTENLAIKAENQRWQDRTNQLIERTNKNPDELKRLTQEKENISKQLGIEREQSKLVKSKLEEQLSQVRREKEEVNTSLLTVEKNITTLRQELNTTKDSLKETADKLSQMEVEMASKEASLIDIRNKETQIRQIAKKYKAQFQELTKTLEDERKLRDEAGPSIPPETEEKLKSLTEQISVLQRDNESLQRENDTLKAGTLEREDRAKTLLKNARNRIQQLAEENKALKEVGDIRGRAKGEGSSTSADNRSLEMRISRLEKEKEEEQLEKERLVRELEVMTQRMSAVQRQLDKQQSLTCRQGAKPSTSSGEKSTSDPPTANIKPMAGPSTSTTKQAQTQHAVTVTPWRETPFASIRPMSQQTRTVVVQPTSQTATAAPTCSQPPLTGRQQQVVHTSSTCEGLSSSPTSSHMDYIPAVSSAVHNILHPNVILGQHMEAESGGAEDSGPIAAAHCVQPAVSIALVLPQPAPQPQDHHREQAGEAVSIENSGVVSASNQEQVSEQSVSASNHGSGAPPTGYYREDSGTGGVASSESSTTAGGSPSSAVVGAVGGSGVAVAGGSGSSASGSSAVATSQQAASSTTSVTTRVAQQAPMAKRPHHDHQDHDKHMPPVKRSRVAALGEATGGEMLLRSDGLEVEYQVPTSSQRDHEDDILVTSDGDESPKALEDGQEFEEEGEEESRYGLEPYGRDAQDLLYHHEEVQEPDMHILDEGSSMDQDNNEVEIIEDSNEVPNQCESSPLVGASSGTASGSGSAVSEETRGTVAGSAAGSGAEAATSSLGQVTSNQQYQARRPTAMPIINRHHVSLSYDDPGDDSIVPSTPTLFMPRRSDGFCETVSSPHVTPVRFTFSQDHPANNMSTNQAVVAGVAQVASEGMDDTRMDLSQLDEGTGRSVPTTPSLVSPQESTIGSEPGRVDESTIGPGASPMDSDPLSSAVVTVPDTPIHDQKKEGDKVGVVAGGSGTAGSSTSSGEVGGDPLLVGEDEEGREAEATTATELSSGSTTSSSSVVLSAAGMPGRSTGTARRSLRVTSRSGPVRSTGRQQPTRIVWQNQEPQQPQPPQQAAAPQTVAMLPIRGKTILSMRSRPVSRAIATSGLDRGAYRLRARRGVRGNFHPGGNFQNQPR